MGKGKEGGVICILYNLLKIMKLIPFILITDGTFNNPKDDVENDHHTTYKKAVLLRVCEKLVDRLTNNYIHDLCMW